MPNLLGKIIGLPEASSGRRPQLLEFQGVNWNSPQAQNLLCFFPMWEDVGSPCFDLGPLGLVGQPTNILRTFDPYFGDVYQGDGNAAGGGTARGYKIPYNAALNFGIGPSPFSICFWYKTAPGFNPATDVYLMVFDDPGQTNFPGYAVSFDTGGTVAVNTGNTSGSDAGHKSAPGSFDGNWHHLCFSHFPQGTAAGAGALNTYFIDGQVSAAYGADFNVGAVGGTVPLFIGTDDDGVSQPFQGYFCDLRIYNTALGAREAAQIYHPDTRWELYQPARKTFFPLPLPPTTTTFTQSLAGSLASSGVLVRQPGKALAGTLAESGTLTRQPAKTLSGSLASSGVFARQTARALAGSLAASGTLLKQCGKAVSGTLTSSGGAVARQCGKALSGSLSPAGTVVRRTARALAGSLTPSGGAVTAIRTRLVSLAGSLTLSGSAVVRSVGKGLSGSLGSTGTLARRIGKPLAGSLAGTGSLARRTSRVSSAALTLAGGAVGVVKSGGSSVAAFFFRTFILPRRSK